MRFSCKHISVGLLLLSYLFLNGCATIKNAPLSSKVTAIDVSKESIGFLTIKVANEKNKSYQPSIKNAFIWDEHTVSDRKKYSFKVTDAYNSPKNEFNEYVISFQLKAGTYVLREMFAQSGFFPVIGSFSIPVFKKITIPENKVIYFGHIDATIVDRTSDDQLRAGPVIPLIDQAVVGASNGTFKMDIQDQYTKDSALIKSQYSYLSNVAIENMTLSQWQTPTAENTK